MEDGGRGGESFEAIIREPVKNYLADFFRSGGNPPPTPLTENHFAKKPLAERGGTPHSGPGGRQINLSK